MVTSLVTILFVIFCTFACLEAEYILSAHRKSKKQMKKEQQADTTYIFQEQ